MPKIAKIARHGNSWAPLGEDWGKEKTGQMGPSVSTMANTPAASALAKTQQAAVNSKFDNLARQIKEPCDRLKTITEAGEELVSDDAELLIALDGDDMCKAWVNSVTDEFIKKGGLPDRSYAFKATRKANGEFKEHYSFPTQAAEHEAEKRREDNRPGAPPARRQSPPHHQDTCSRKAERPAFPMTNDVPPTQAASNKTVSLGSSSATDKMLAVSVERECRGVLVGLRPPNNKRFNGDKNKINFDNHLKSFERAMKEEGASDAIKVGELVHWFTGEAADL